MNEEEFEIIDSSLNQTVEQHGQTYRVAIYRSEHSDWILEVVTPDGTSTVWEDQFDDDEEALTEALSAIQSGDLGEIGEAPPFVEAMSGELAPPLDEDEMAFLDDFLLERVPEDEVEEGDDEGILNISELDGFLTAIICSPDLIPPSQWIESIWGEFEPEWAEFKDFQEVMALFLRHMNAISAILNNTQPYEPLLQELSYKGQHGVVVDEWCVGFVRGMALSPAPWRTEDEGVDKAIQRIRQLGDDDDPNYLLQHTPAESEEIADWLPTAIQSIYRYHYVLRGASSPSNSAPYSREMPKVGRNDPCPCGSGKKFKKCCLH
jgi:uncharacterized protein